jgi:hypothetical protein
VFERRSVRASGGRRKLRSVIACDEEFPDLHMSPAAVRRVKYTNIRLAEHVARTSDRSGSYIQRSYVVSFLEMPTRKALKCDEG